MDENHELCQQFYKDGLTTSFTKLMTDQAVTGWRSDIYKCINTNVELLIKLSVVKIMDECIEIMDLLSLVLNPMCKFHVASASRESELVAVHHTLKEDELFARTLRDGPPKVYRRID